MGFDSRRWLRTRQGILQQLKNQVKLRLGSESSDVIRYAEEYKKEFVGRWKELSEYQFYRQLRQGSLILGGDFHAFRQSQRSHLRLLRDLPPSESVVIGVECLESRFQSQLDDYLTGQLSEKRFLEATQWANHWGFPWENYQPLFSLAVERGYPVVALNRYFKNRTGAKLHLRDQHAAKVLAKTRRQYPDHLIYVLYGDLHLAEAHLFRAIQEEPTLRREKILRLFLNSETLYFRQARKGPVNPQVLLQGSGDRYCLLTSPPWVKWQSYLIYLEQTYDRELGEDGGIEYTDHLAALIRLAASDLDIDLKAQDIAVYGSEDRAFPQMVSELVSDAELKILHYLMDRDRSFFIPRGGIFYLSRPSINHAAGLAGQYIQARVSGRTRPPWEMPSDFVASIWIEAVSFFVSKLINPHRKSESLHQIRQELEAGDIKGRGRETLLVVLDQRMSEIIQIHSGRRREPRYRAPRRVHYLEASRILGNMMGERLFRGVKSGRLSQSALIKLISQDAFADDFIDIYFQTVKRLESHDPEAQKRGAGS